MHSCKWKDQTPKGKPGLIICFYRSFIKLDSLLDKVNLTRSSSPLRTCKHLISLKNDVDPQTSSYTPVEKQPVYNGNGANFAYYYIEIGLQINTATNHRKPSLFWTIVKLWRTKIQMRKYDDLRSIINHLYLFDGPIIDSLIYLNSF